MRTRTTFRWAVSAGAMFLAACSSDQAPAKGELMLSVQTDMEIPKDVSSVRLEVSRYGNVLFANEYEVGPTGLNIPATLAIVAGSDPAAPARIRLIARQKNVLRVLREAVTTVPTDRIALLRLPIQWLCDGMAKETTSGDVESTCPDGQTCIAGRCVSSEVDGSTLPTYRPESVFGGGSEEGDGTCLDTVACFSLGAEVPVDTTTCTIDPVPTGGAGTNVALVLPPNGDGICGPEACLIPLDAESASGWTTLPTGRIALPPAVCDKLAAQKIAGVALSTACAEKTESVPTCGPWSSVRGSGAGTFDAGGPKVREGSTGDAGATDSALSPDVTSNSDAATADASLADVGASDAPPSDTAPTDSGAVDGGTVDATPEPSPDASIDAAPLDIPDAIADAGAEHTDADVVEASVEAGTVIGSILDLSTSQGVAATVTIGGQPAEMSWKGWFTSQNVAAGTRVPVVFEAPGYVKLLSTVSLRAKGLIYVDARLAPANDVVTIDAAAGGTATGTLGSQVTIPAGALRTSAGATYSGTARVRLTGLDPTGDSEVRSRTGISGDFMAEVEGSSDLVPLDPTGVAFLSITDNAEPPSPLAIDPTIPVTLALPISTSSSGLPNSLPLWFFDEATGVWTASGSASYYNPGSLSSTEGSSPSATYRATSVARTGLFSVAQTYSTACLQGQVYGADGQTPLTVAGLGISASGSSSLWSTTAYTDDQGKFSILVKASNANSLESATVSVQGGSSVTVDGTPTTLASAGCSSLSGSLIASYPLARFVMAWADAPRSLETHFTGPSSQASGSETASRYDLNVKQSVAYSSSEATLATLTAYATDSSNDVLVATGPQETDLYAAYAGTYVFSVVNESGEGDPDAGLGLGPLRTSSARVLAYTANGLQIFDVAQATGTATSSNPVWRVFQFTVDAQGTLGSLQAIGTLGDCADASSCLN